MRELSRDLRYAARTLVGMRGTAVVAVLTLALGIGATTTIFSVVYAALFRPLPFRDADRLVMLFTTQATARYGTQRMRWSYREIGLLRSQTTAFERICWYTGSQLAIDSRQWAGEPPNPEQTQGEIVSPGYFELLGIAPQLGRGLVDADDASGSPQPVAVISSGLWRRRYASDPHVLGRTLTVSGQPLTIVGVTPDGFNGLTGRADFWFTTAWAPALNYRDYLTTSQHFITVVAKLRPDVSVERARAEIVRLAPTSVVDDRKTAGEQTWSADVWPLSRARIDTTAERSVLLLMAAVGCVLLIACVNVASVLLARAGGRRREVAIRMAIGSTRARLVRQLLTESLLLAAIAGAVGTLVAAWGIGVLALPAVNPSGRNLYGALSTFSAPALDASALLFTIAVTAATAVAFGVVPALDASRTDLVTALKDGGPTGDRRRGRMLSTLVTGEVALAVLLLAGAGLLLKGFVQLQSRRVGYDGDRVVSFWVSPPVSRYPVEQGPATVERVLSRIQRVPGVTAAAVNRCTPFTGCSRSIVFVDGRDPDPARAPGVGRHYVSADYFRVLGIPLRMGRAFTDADRAGHPKVTVVNETAARRFWPGENPIGKRVWFGLSTGFTSAGDAAEVVGVVGDVQYQSAEDPMQADFYTSYLQFSYPDTMVIVKADRNPAALVPSLRAAVASIDPGLPIHGVQTIDDRVDAALARPRFNAALVGGFAMSAMLLAAVGVFGVMAYSVSSRTHEIGVRMALGASGALVVRLVLAETARLALAGAGIGLVLAVAASRVMRTALIGVAGADPGIYIIVAGAMTFVALAAAFLPARRASRIDPMILLRME